MKFVSISEVKPHAYVLTEEDRQSSEALVSAIHTTDSIDKIISLAMKLKNNEKRNETIDDNERKIQRIIEFIHKNCSGENCGKWFTIWDIQNAIGNSPHFIITALRRMVEWGAVKKKHCRIREGCIGDNYIGDVYSYILK